MVHRIEEEENPVIPNNKGLTKEERKHLLECAEYLIELIPKSKKPEALGAANEIFIFLERHPVID